MEQLLELGVRTVPCVAVGQRYVLARDLKDAAAFLGISWQRELLPPARLVAMYLEVLASAVRMVRQIPAQRLDDPAIANRPRTLRSLTDHIFRIADSFLLSCAGPTFSEAMAQPQNSSGSLTEIVEYGDQVRKRLDIWWQTTADKACRKSLGSDSGPRTVQDVLEQCTCHSAQHCRQLAAVLDRLGIKADGPPTLELLSGLPLPNGLWE